MDAGPDVRFDFEGSLALARRLWSLADEIETMMATRVSLAREALTTWRGVYGEQFVGRIETEDGDVTAIAGQLRAGANGWAANWRDAMNQQNRVLYARQVKHVEDNRGVLDSIVGGITGHDDLPPMPAEVSAPVAPGFAPTGSFVRY